MGGNFLLIAVRFANIAQTIAAFADQRGLRPLNKTANEPEAIRIDVNHEVHEFRFERDLDIV